MTTVATLCLSLWLAAPTQPHLGQVVTKSTTFQPGTYRLVNETVDGKSAALYVSGHNITVDFAGAKLEGTSVATLPDQRKGTGLLVAGSNITIKNLKVRGYKVGLFARNVAGLRLVNCDFSYNWKQHLKSTPEREDLSDWMSFHQNEKDEWLRYGAGIYLRNCDKFEIKGTRALGGQCGLMMTGCDNGLVWNCDFSYLSAIGVGMYRSSGNRILHNRIDFCVRGHSEGVYNRGQDSAGILIYEQSNKNVFAYNSVTHGGDGFFLWAGQSTMDNGQGGCNDNLLFGNDFSFAPTNGIEATFSRNQFVNNRIEGCWHGMWGGYSYDSLILGNDFSNNEDGIALEHGQNNRFVANQFFGNKTGIRLWQNASEDPNWGYPKNRDTKSHDPLIERNGFVANVLGISLRDTINAKLIKNYFDGKQGGLNLELLGKTDGLAASGNRVRRFRANDPFPPDGNDIRDVAVGFPPPYFWSPWVTKDTPAEVARYAPAPMKDGNDPFSIPGRHRTRAAILVDEWGPYDYLSPRLWPRKSERGDQIVLDTLGPKGTWKVAKLPAGQTISARSGKIGDPITVTFAPGQAVDVDVELEFVGGAITTPFGQWLPAGAPYRFGFKKFFVPIAWDIRWFAWDKATQDPRSQSEAFKTLLETGNPIKELKADRLDFAWSGRLAKDLPSDYFATLATGQFQIAPGEYTLSVTSDDGVRVWIDDKVVLENWTWHGPTLDTAKLKLGGSHRIRVEHFEIDGYSTLQLRIEK